METQITLQAGMLIKLLRQAISHRKAALGKVQSNGVRRWERDMMTMEYFDYETPVRIDLWQVAIIMKYADPNSKLEDV